MGLTPHARSLSRIQRGDGLTRTFSKTCGSFTDVKKPEHALKLFVRFALAKGVITYGMELMLALFNIVQGTISVSYTHLDVYKRQILCHTCEAERTGLARNELCFAVRGVFSLSLIHI